MKRYIILRDLNRASARSDTRDASPESFGPATRELDGFAPDDLPAPAVETVALPLREADDLARDPDVKGHGEVMQGDSKNRTR